MDESPRKLCECISTFNLIKQQENKSLNLDKDKEDRKFNIIDEEDEDFEDDSNFKYANKIFKKSNLKIKQSKMTRIASLEK